MAKNNLVTLLMSTYQGEHYIKEQIESIQEQTHTNWRLIVRDDGSKDHTLAIIKQLANDDNRIHILEDTKGNLGALQSFNTLASSLPQDDESQYYMFADQDDIWLPNKISLCLQKMSAQLSHSSHDTPILIHTDLEVVDERMNTIALSFWQYQKINPNWIKINQLLIQNCVTGCTSFMNQAAFRLARNIPEDAIMHDWWLALQIILEKGLIIPLHEQTIRYRQHGRNDTGAKAWSFAYILKRICNAEQNNKSLDKTISQAQALLKQLPPSTTNEDRNIITNYAQIKQKSWVKKRLTLMKYKLFKSNLIRNIGLFIYI